MLKVAPSGLLLWLFLIFCLRGGLFDCFMQCVFIEAPHHAKLPQVWSENLWSKLVVEIRVQTFGVEIGVNIGVENSVDFCGLTLHFFTTRSLKHFDSGGRHSFPCVFHDVFSHEFPRHFHFNFHDRSHEIITAGSRFLFCTPYAISLVSSDGLVGGSW